MQTKQEKIEGQKYYARFIIGFFFILAIFLTIIGIEIYRRTVVDQLTLFLVVAIGAAIGIFLFWKRSLVVMNKFLAVFNSCTTGGGLFYYFFLFFNCHFASPKLMAADFEIIESGTLARGGKSSCSQPFFVINFNGKEKQLVFKCTLEYSLEDYTLVNVVYQEGLFGFEYIIEKHPKTD